MGAVGCLWFRFEVLACGCLLVVLLVACIVVLFGLVLVIGALVECVGVGIGFLVFAFCLFGDWLLSFEIFG